MSRDALSFMEVSVPPVAVSSPRSSSSFASFVAVDPAGRGRVRAWFSRAQLGPGAGVDDARATGARC